MSYKGTANIPFEIERMRDKITGKYVMVDSVAEDAGTHIYECIELDVQGYSYYQEGRTSGLPENCYPDEGDTEIESVIGPGGKDWEDELTGREREALLEAIDEHVRENSFKDYDRDYDDYYDDTY